MRRSNSLSRTVFSTAGSFGRTSSEPFLEACGAIRPLRRAPKRHTGRNFIHRPPPENTLLGVGGRLKEGGRIKFLQRKASKYTPAPPPPPEHAFWAKNVARGGGRAYRTSPWKHCRRPRRTKTIQYEHVPRLVAANRACY